MYIGKWNFCHIVYQSMCYNKINRYKCITTNKLLFLYIAVIL